MLEYRGIRTVIYRMSTRENDPREKTIAVTEAEAALAESAFAWKNEDHKAVRTACRRVVSSTAPEQYKSCAHLRIAQS